MCNMDDLHRQNRGRWGVGGGSQILYACGRMWMWGWGGSVYFTLLSLEYLKIRPGKIFENVFEKVFENTYWKIRVEFWIPRGS